MQHSQDKTSYLYFKIIIIEELLVHSVCVGIDGPQEHSDRQKCTHLLYKPKQNTQIKWRRIKEKRTSMLQKITPSCSSLIVDDRFMHKKITTLRKSLLRIQRWESVTYHKCNLFVVYQRISALTAARAHSAISDAAVLLLQIQNFCHSDRSW